MTWSKKEKVGTAVGVVIGAGVLAMIFWPKSASASSSKGIMDYYKSLPAPPDEPKLWPSNDNEKQQVDPEPGLSFLEPGRYLIASRTEYKIPHKAGKEFTYDILVHEDDGWKRAVYGPDKDWIWEKETRADFAIVQFQEPGIYRLWVPNSGEWEFVVE